MSWDRILVPSYLVFMLLAAIAAPVALWQGFLSETRFAVCALFVGGSVCRLIGYLRYIPSGSRVTALLILLVGKSLIFAILGVGFFVVAVWGGGTENVTASLLVTYALFAAAGAAKGFTGIYVMLGAGRGWISKEVYKFPLLDGDHKKYEDRGEKNGEA